MPNNQLIRQIEILNAEDEILRKRVPEVSSNVDVSTGPLTCQAAAIRQAWEKPGTDASGKEIVASVDSH